MVTSFLIAAAMVGVDFDAEPAALESGIKGYRAVAETVRKEAVRTSDATVKGMTNAIASFRRGMIRPSLAGFRNSEGVQIDGVWYFGTAAEKQQRIERASKDLDEWREHARLLKSRKTEPQVILQLDDATPGAAGVPFWTLEVESVIDRRKFTCDIARFEIRWINDKPSLFFTDNRTSELKVIVEHSGELEVHVGDKPAWLNVYQFTGVRNKAIILRRVYEIEVGPRLNLFSRRGDQVHVN